MRLRQGMAVGTLIGVTLLLMVGLSIILALTFRASVRASWDESRCKPGVVVLAALFKPDDDPRSGSEFAKANWSFCQTQYVQSAIRIASSEVQALADSQSTLVGIASSAIDGMSKVFTDLWAMCYKAYAMFMERFNAAAKLMRNMMINMYSMVDRLQAVTVSIALGLISLVAAMIATVRVTLMVAIIIIGILLILQIVMFYIFAPISGLILTISTMVMATAVIVTTAIAATIVSRFTNDMGYDDSCFTGDTIVLLKDGRSAINKIRLGDILEDGGRVTAIHEFSPSAKPLYDVYGIIVSGTHLIEYEDELIPVRDYPDAVLVKTVSAQMLYSLTTTTRRIPVVGRGILVRFADWEEIDAEDTFTLETWYCRVFELLNGVGPVHRPVSLRSEAGFSPECTIQRYRFRGFISSVFPFLETVPAKQIRIGDRLADQGIVTGIVHIAGSEVERVVELPGNQSGSVGSQSVSWATWVLQNGVWKEPVGTSTETCRSRFMHLYTTTGVVQLGDWKIRDASDIGLHRVNTLVQELIIGQ